MNWTIPNSSTRESADKYLRTCDQEQINTPQVSRSKNGLGKFSTAFLRIIRKALGLLRLTVGHIWAYLCMPQSVLTYQTLSAPYFGKLLNHH